MNRAESTMAEFGRRREGVGSASEERVGEAAMLVVVVVVVKWRGAVVRELAVEEDCEEDD